MNAKIRRLRINYLFGYKNIDMNLDDVTVLVGNNGTGKSTILRIIHSLLTLSESESLKLCEFAELWLDDDIKVIYENFYKDDSREIVEKIFVDTINSSDINMNRMESEDILKLMTKKLDNYKRHKKENKFRIYKDGLKTTQGLYIKNFLSELGVEYISTVDLSANSRFNYTTMEGEGVNMLDTYIEVESKKLHADRRPVKRTVLRRVMNNHLADSGKRMRRTASEITIECLNSGVLSYKALSSGERQLLYIMLKVVNGRDRNSIILMDEPEISLHLNWQETLIDSIREINPLSQLIIVTHSPGIVMNGYRDAFRDMKDIEMDAPL
ncbi:AAA family ATPase [Enterobacter quasiroggenkampii]|uniref:AAA family ATPase n=1 Tax=Enterobacter quasiroggenkampii TaxID=2497436 RepID=UPI0020752955|nr:AAA family ATPase [Enterobacter quasiroggenkampii]MCM7529995.1 AAA family ATPase [Enterobacter quasiroggenkampii]